MRPNAQRGFTLIETLIAVAISAIIIAILTVAIQWALQWGRTIATRQTEHAQFEALLDHLHADEDTAWAIFTPTTDVLGQPNTDGHEADFFTRDGHDRPYFWAYRYDNSAKTITKYVYGHPGTTPILDPASVVNNVASFSAATYGIDKLADATSPIYNPLFAGKTLTPVAIHYGYGSEVAGGNQITAITFTGTSIAESVQLTTQTAPSGWTVRFHYRKTVAALSVWPKYVVYGANGANVATIPHDSMAAEINALLGGAVAYAANTTCKARAFVDSGFTQPDPIANPDGSGCYDGHITASEPGYQGPFSMPGGGCATAIEFGRWSPTISGSASIVASGAMPIQKCTIVIESLDQTDLSNPSQAVTAEVVSGGGCSFVGESCTFALNSMTPIADCQYDGSGITTQNPGWTYGDPGTFQVGGSGNGTVVDNGDGTATFTRTKLGPATVSYGGPYTNWNGSPNISGNPCNAMKTTFQPSTTVQFQ